MIARDVRILAVMAAALAAVPAGARAQLGLSLQGYAGIGDLVRDLHTTRDAAYGAIAGVQFAGPLGLELEYQHAENHANGGADLIEQDGVLGHVRFDLLRGPVSPFVFGGVGAVRYSVSSVTDDQVVLPLGVGVEVQLSPLVLGARGEYQWIPNAVADKNADYWKVVLTAGVRVP